MATAGVNIYYHGFRCGQYCYTGTCGTSMLPQSLSRVIRLFDYFEVQAGGVS